MLPHRLLLRCTAKNQHRFVRCLEAGLVVRWHKVVVQSDIDRSGRSELFPTTLCCTQSGSDLGPMNDVVLALHCLPNTRSYGFQKYSLANVTCKNVLCMLVSPPCQCKTFISQCAVVECISPAMKNTACCLVWPRTVLSRHIPQTAKTTCPSGVWRTTPDCPSEFSNRSLRPRPLSVSSCAVLYSGQASGSRVMPNTFHT